MAEACLTAMAAIFPGAELAWNGHGHWPDDRPTPGRGLPAGDWFDAPRLMAGVRHRYFNDSARYSVAASRACLDADTPAAWARTREERRGVILGTAVADYSVRHHLDPQLIAGGFSAMNTVSAPNISANIAAAQVAISCKARAFSTTLTSPFLSGFESLYLAAQSLQLGRTDAVLAIAAEEALPVHEDRAMTPGAVALHLQPALSSRGIGQVVAASAWGHVDDHAAPSPNTRAFLQRALDSVVTGAEPLALELLRVDTALSTGTAERWRTWLDDAGLRFGQTREQTFATLGTVDPMLCAAQALSHARPLLLLAIQQRRYLAFLFIPNVSSTHLGASS